MSKQAVWWEEPYRIVQTNLRLIDASLDPRALARQGREFGASAITFNVGGIFAFYPTGLDLHARNPYLEKGQDLTGEMLSAARREGLRMIGRFDLSKGTQIAYDAHPDWFVHNEAGEPQEFNGTYQACVNGGWASDYSLRILREGIERYDLDGAFFNMTGYQPYDYSGRYRGICHCSNCQEGFAEMFGRALPRREDFSDPAFADYLLFKRRTSVEAAQRIYDTVKSLRPSTGVMGNGKGACDFMRLEIQRAVSRPAPEWPHQPGELARWGEAIGGGKAYSCASTNFLDYQWRYASETAHNHMLRFGQQIASGAQIDYYLLGTFDQPSPAPLETVHEFLEWHEANGEHLTMTRSRARVGLYHSRVSDLHAGASETGKARTNAFRGAYRLLLEARIPFDFVSDERMEDDDIARQLSRYDVILMPNTPALSDAEARALDAWVEAGGTLIATGETGHYDERGNRRDGFALASFPARAITRARSGLETYVAAGEGEAGFAVAQLLHLDGWYFDAEARNGAREQLLLQPEQKYGPPELCFPKDQAGAGPGVLRMAYGKGEAIYLPWLPEWLYFRDGLPGHRELLSHLIEAAYQPEVRLAGAGPVEITIRAKQRGEGQKVVHVVNYAGQRGSAYEEPPVVPGLRLGVLGANGKARTLVSGQEIAFGAPGPDGYCWADLPDVKYFEVILLPEAAN
ncbi:hypothetical protein GCM10011494_35350 [Novosphingobium endophyticum]|uniref:Beta-galactosidase trimerisation domain-containing protein n=1 Tax=Novosphingobium endophyticum TaxID=1955250 RepID=A0A916X647_9SPHN|nr:alpha-amylase family protein [Novosphingobium endophyticum]GGC13455.1 hypothetical protein GCM10011494_35350 [Novosphingobium endophyticum]